MSVRQSHKLLIWVAKHEKLSKHVTVVARGGAAHTSFLLNPTRLGLAHVLLYRVYAQTSFIYAQQVYIYVKLRFPYICAQTNFNCACSLHIYQED